MVPRRTLLAFASHRNANRAVVYKKASSGEGQEQTVYSTGTQNEHPIDWSPDGKFLLVHANGGGMDLLSVPLAGGDVKPVPFISSSVDDSQGQFSSDPFAPLRFNLPVQ